MPLPRWRQRHTLTDLGEAALAGVDPDQLPDLAGLAPDLAAAA